MRIVNRRTLETLIYCGAFDQLNPNRRQLIEDLEYVIPWVQKRTKEKESGQLSLFDLFAQPTQSHDTEDPEFDQIPTAPPTPDFTLEEKLKLEKENLGFYVSEHPLKAIQKSAKLLSPIELSQLEEQGSRKRVSAVVTINYVKKIITKKGTPMAFVGLQDISTQAEGVVFSDTYERIQDLLQQDACLIIWGKVEKKDDDKYQVIIDNAEAVEQVKMLMINLPIEEIVNLELQNRIKSLLQEQSGDKNRAKVPVIAIIGTGKNRQIIRFGQKYWVQSAETALLSLKNAGLNVDCQPLVSSN